MDTTYLIEPRDPILARDARPFSAQPGAFAQSLPWPLPSTTTGAIRTYLGGDWSQNPAVKAAQMLQVSVHGPLLVAKREGGQWQVYYPAPADAVIYDTQAEGAVGDPNKKPKKVMNLLPLPRLPEGAGCNLPDGLLPVCVTEDVKPSPEFAFWSHEYTTARLASSTPGEDPPTEGIKDLPKDSRVHVSINPETKTGVEGRLFATTSLVFPDGPLVDRGTKVGWQEIGMICKVVGAPNGIARRLQPLAGEKRLAYIAPGDGLWPTIPKELVEACSSSTKLKLQLVTPAIFEHGWKPGWLKEGLLGTPPGLDGISLKLVSAAVPRRGAVSGWDYKAKGPKPSRFLAPAGSVYFFEVASGSLTEQVVRSLWLSSVSDSEQDRRDGFGLAIPGIWDYYKEDTSGQ